MNFERLETDEARARSFATSRSVGSPFAGLSRIAEHFGGTLRIREYFLTLGSPRLKDWADNRFDASTVTRQTSTTPFSQSGNQIADKNCGQV
jgi:hypothetical protein